MASYAEASLVSSMSFLAEAQANVAHNLANANTTGFKRSEAVAETTTSRFRGMLDVALPTVRFSKAVDWTQGIPEPTNEKLHVALEEPGTFFRVRNRDGSNYFTRRGDLKIDAEGYLATANGARYLDNQDQEIQIGSVGELIIKTNGEINSADSGADSTITLGTLGVFSDQGLTLESVGAGLFRDPTNQLLTTNASATIRQGSLERSNVEVVTELVRMIEIQRSFQAVSRALTSIGRLGSSFTAALNR